MDTDHLEYMRRALDLALMAEGQTSPNPMVGAVIVKEGRVIGEGYHHKAGGPHAEVEALRAVSESPAGAVVYVSLEPCCHFGKTPPCARALIEAGVAEVHYAVPDDNPKVSGGGHKMLVDAGIRVFRGPLEDEGRFLNRAFFHYITRGRSHVTAKYAMSLDGRIATASGSSQWITGPRARSEGHRLRQVCDAILVGAGTVQTDNPRLTTRLEDVEPSHPVRVVLDSTGRLPLESRIFDRDLPGDTLLATTSRMAASHRAALEDRGVEVLVTPSNQAGQVGLPSLLEVLAQRNLVRVMVEGGGQLLGAFHDGDLIDEAWVFLGGKMIGGVKAPGPLGGRGIDQISDAASFRIYDSLPLDGDFLIKAVRVDNSGN